MTAGNWHQGPDGRCVGCSTKLHGSGSCVDCAAKAMAGRHIPGLDPLPTDLAPVVKLRPGL